MRYRNIITVEDNNKKKNITNLINTQIYIPILYVTKMTQNKNDSIIIIENNNFLLQDFHNRSVSQIAEMEGGYHLLSYKN